MKIANIANIKFKCNPVQLHTTHTNTTQLIAVTFSETI